MTVGSDVGSGEGELVEGFTLGAGVGIKVGVNDVGE